MQGRDSLVKRVSKRVNKTLTTQCATVLFTSLKEHKTTFAYNNLIFKTRISTTYYTSQCLYLNLVCSDILLYNHFMISNLIHLSRLRFLNFKTCARANFDGRHSRIRPRSSSRYHTSRTSHTRFSSLHPATATAVQTQVLVVQTQRQVTVASYRNERHHRGRQRTSRQRRRQRQETRARDRQQQQQ